MKKLLCLLLTLAILFGIAACGGNQPPAPGGQAAPGPGPAEPAPADRQIRVGFAQKTLDGPYFVALVETVEAEARRLGWEITVLEAGDDTQRESENMDALIAMGKDLIFLNSVDPYAAVAVIQRAWDAGIGVINLDSGVADGTQQITTVYSNNYQNGRHVGLAFVDYFDEDIHAILLSGAMGNVAGRERRMGLFWGIIEGRLGIPTEEAYDLAQAFEDQLVATGRAENAEARFVVGGQGWGAWTEEVALPEAEDLIVANPQLNVALGESDQMLFGVMTALANAGIEGVQIVAAADGARRAIRYVQEGRYFGTGENSPILVGRLGVEIARQILEDGADPASFDPIIMTEAVAITTANAAERYQFGF